MRPGHNLPLKVLNVGFGMGWSPKLTCSVVTGDMKPDNMSTCPIIALNMGGVNVSLSPTRITGIITRDIIHSEVGLLPISCARLCADVRYRRRLVTVSKEQVNEHH